MNQTFLFFNFEREDADANKVNSVRSLPFVSTPPRLNPRGPYPAAAPSFGQTQPLGGQFQQGFGGFQQQGYGGQGQQQPGYGGQGQQQQGFGGQGQQGFGGQGQQAFGGQGQQAFGGQGQQQPFPQGAPSNGGLGQAAGDPCGMPAAAGAGLGQQGNSAAASAGLGQAAGGAQGAASGAGAGGGGGAQGAATPGTRQRGPLSVVTLPDQAEQDCVRVFRWLHTQTEAHDLAWFLVNVAPGMNHVSYLRALNWLCQLYRHNYNEDYNGQRWPQEIIDTVFNIPEDDMSVGTVSTAFGVGGAFGSVD